MDLSAEEQKLEETRVTMEKRKVLVLYAETRAGQIVVSYILFVAATFCSISWSSSSLVLLRIRWVFFSQILLISAVFWLAITKVIKRLLRAKYYYEQSLIELEMLHKEKFMVQSGHEKRSKQQDHQLQQQQQKDNKQLAIKPHPVTQRQWYTYVFSIVSPLIAFTVFTLYACIVIICSTSNM